MKIDMQLYEVVNLNEAFKHVIECDSLDTVTKFTTLGNVRVITPKVDDFTKLRNELVRKYGTEKGSEETNDKRLTVEPTDEHYEDFAKEVDELAQSNVSVELETLDASKILANIKDVTVLSVLYPIMEVKND